MLLDTPTPTPLWRNHRFQLVWIGSAFTFLGLEVADLAYPLMILATTGSPAWAAAFGVVQTLAALAGGLPAGSLVDRFDQRRLLLAAEGGRALTTASVAAALITGHLTLAHLLVAAVVLGLGGPLGGSARMLVVRTVVPPQQLTAALTQEEVRTNGAALAGPPLGGLLYGLGAAVPFVFTAVAYLVSWCCALFVRLPPSLRGPSTKQPGPAGGMFAGIGELWGDRLLRPATLLVITLNLIGAPLALIPVVILHAQHVAAWLIGAALAGFAVGGLAGAGLVGPLHRRLQPGTILLGVAAVQVPLLLALGVPLGPWWVAGVLFVSGLGIPSLRVLFDVLVFRQVPPDRQGRTIGAFMTMFSLGPPVGIAAGGLLLQFLSPAAAVTCLAAVLVAGVLYAARQPGLRHARWPAPAQP